MPLVDGIPVASLLSGEASADARQWAVIAKDAFCGCTQQQISVMLEPVLDLASGYLTHVLIAGW